MTSRAFYTAVFCALAFGTAAQSPRTHRLEATPATAAFLPGIVIPLRPFFGSMGVAPPPAMGRISSTPPGIHAGNLDHKELVAGTTLAWPRGETPTHFITMGVHVKMPKVIFKP